MVMIKKCLRSLFPVMWCASTLAMEPNTGLQPWQEQIQPFYEQARAVSPFDPPFQTPVFDDFQQEYIDPTIFNEPQDNPIYQQNPSLPTHLSEEKLLELLQKCENEARAPQTGTMNPPAIISQEEMKALFDGSGDEALDAEFSFAAPAATGSQKETPIALEGSDDEALSAGLNKTTNPSAKGARTAEAEPEALAITDGPEAGRIRCSLCQQTMPPDFFDLHKETHKDSNLSCDHPGCTFTFKSERFLTLHLYYDHGDHRLRCTYPGCTRKFKKEFDRHRHISACHRGGPCKCCHPGCTKSFISQKQLLIHKRSHKK